MNTVHQSTHKAHDTFQSGFTLIELSMVLVIIGLIVGGILVGQDLIKAAQVRATVSQLEKYNSAVNTFRTKYNSLPGDLAIADATSFGLYVDSGATGHGDGNGLIEGGAAGASTGIGETLVFWRHLSDAGFIDGSFGVAGNSLLAAGTGTVTATVTTVNQSLPTTKAKPSQDFVVFSASGLNYFQIAPIATIPASGVYTYGATGMSPIDAQNIDRKLDDGMPETGIVQAKGIAAINAAPSFAAGSTAATCTIGTGVATDTYNLIAASGGNDLSCALRERFN